MAHEFPRPNFRSYSAIGSITVWRIEKNFVDFGATDASVFAAGEEEMLIKFTIENNRRARDRVSGQAASASCNDSSKELSGRCARRKHSTSGAPYA